MNKDNLYGFSGNKFAQIFPATQFNNVYSIQIRFPGNKTILVGY